MLATEFLFCCFFSTRPLFSYLPGRTQLLNLTQPFILHLVFVNYDNFFPNNAVDFFIIYVNGFVLDEKVQSIRTYCTYIITN